MAQLLGVMAQLLGIIDPKAIRLVVLTCLKPFQVHACHLNQSPNMVEQQSRLEPFIYTIMHISCTIYLSLLLS